MGGFVLPDAPPELAGKAVRAWSAPVVIPTYMPLAADKNPMFLEKRVYQGSSGRVYPLPFVDRISTEKVERAWQAIHIENEYVRLMILPELGGRIHVGLDKTNGYDFFYRQNVIKPALVGLAGPWISGGVEFNWPQHHRPSTFMPVDTHIEEHADGSITVWCSEHEPMTRMKGMHGVHLKPGSSLIELKVRLYNRTELPQTFLWWANVAARVHERYQSFFPPDVQVVADHAKRAMARFPLCDGRYYGVDYALARHGNARQSRASDAEPRFPPADYPPNDLTWYANIPVPTSYMILGTKEDFFGGYDHHVQAGFVHVADHRIAPGKKQWTWGNHPFGYAWDRNLTDPDDPTDAAPPYRRNLPAPYIELMAGVFTDNQPDFSYLMPGEMRAFSQYWYPIQRIGPAVAANERCALSLTGVHHEDMKGTKSHEEGSPRRHGDTEGVDWVRVGVVVTGKIVGARVVLMRGDDVVLEKAGLELVPGKAWVEEVRVGAGVKMTELRVAVYEGAGGAGGESGDSRSMGREVLAYQAVERVEKEVPAAAVEPGLPGEVGSVEELYLIGVHLEQYRHATRMPEDYWLEALRREPGDARCNNALGLWHLRRGEFAKAVERFETAIATLTKWNPNPRDGEVFYNLGIALWHLNRLEEARNALSKAEWNHAWERAANNALMRLNCKANPLPLGAGGTRGVFPVLLQLQDGLRNGGEGTRTLFENHLKWAQEQARKDNFLDAGVTFLLNGRVPCDVQQCLDVALEFAKWSQFEKALTVLDTFKKANENTSPLVMYYLAYLQDHYGERDAAAESRRAAALAPTDHCFPHRLEEIAILQDAIEKNPADARAPYYLGCLFYDKRRHEEAIGLWEKAVRLDRAFPTVWRNLGIGYFNVMKDKLAAKGAYQKAFTNSLVWGVREGEKGSGGEGENMERESPDSQRTANQEIRVPRGDARILYERDQLWKRTQEMPEARAAELEKYPELVKQRDDLTVEYCTLLNQLGRHEEALVILQWRQFQPWEGGEGLVVGQWARTHIALGRRTLWREPGAGGSPQRALEHFLAGLHPPENLGETWHLLQNNAELHYWAGMACAKGGQGDKVTRGQGDKESVGHFEMAAGAVGDFQGMAVRAYSEASYWSGLALQELGQPQAARKLFEAMLAYAEGLRKTPAKIDYFATSLPAMLLFEEDIQARQLEQATLMEALARHGLNGESGKDRKSARRLLNDLLAENPSHGLAADLMVALEWT